MNHETRSVLVTHADEPLGRRLVKRLYHDENVHSILAVGSGPPPRSFDGFLGSSQERVRYARVDLTKHRPVADLFHSSLVREAGVDVLVHVPRHGPPESGRRPRLPAGVAQRTAEARLILQHAIEVPTIRHLVAIGSAFVYRPAPGNSNRYTEKTELNLDPELAPELRSWIDCDMIFHGEVNSHQLRVVLLRIPTVVSSGGYVYMNPALASPLGSRQGPGVRALGFNPMCALVSDKDVARAASLAIHSHADGIFNIAGRESVPLSVLTGWMGRGSMPVPGPILRVAARAAQFVGATDLSTALDGPYVRYGFTLDTSRAETLLGFRPGYRIGLGRAGDGALRIETAPA